MRNCCAGSSRPTPLSVKLLALDVDDTLTGADGRISRRCAKVVEGAQEMGVAVTLVTGRRYLTSAQRAANALRLRGPIACHYGRALIRHPEGTCAAVHPLDPGVCRRVLQLAREHRLLPSLCADEIFYWTPEVWKSAGSREYPMTEVVGDLNLVLDERGDRVMSMALSGRGAGEAKRLLTAEFGDLVHVYSQPVGGKDQTIEVILNGAADKGTALVEICRLLGIDSRHAVAVGDAEADIPLLRAAGYGIAMPWSTDRVRRAADMVAEGAPEEAAAAAIEAVLFSDRLRAPHRGGEGD